MAGRSEQTVKFQGCVLGNTVEADVRVRKTEIEGGRRMDFLGQRNAGLSQRRRYAFIAQVPGQVWIFSQGGTSYTASWPTIGQNVEAKRRWILLVVDDSSGKALTREKLIGATYFDCPTDRVLPRSPSRNDIMEMVGTIEAVEPVGWTVDTDAEIRAKVQQLEPYWKVSDSIIWNSQHFSLHLAALMLSDTDFNTKKADFISLSQKLYFAAHNAEGNFMLTKHVCCMAGMAVSGVLTFGFGAVGFWALGGASIGNAGYVQVNVDAQIRELRGNFVRFRGWA